MNTKVRFSTFTIDFEDVRAAALKRGWQESSKDSPNDFVDAETCAIRTIVSSSKEGINRCLKFIQGGHSCYGQEVVNREELQLDCDGYYHWVETNRWLVDDEGVAEHLANLGTEEAE